MNEIFSRIKASGRQVATVVAFVVIAAVAQMAIPSMLGTMIDKGVGDGQVRLSGRLHPDDAGRIRHDALQGRGERLAGPAATAHHRAGDRREPGDHDPRRGDEQRRRPHRAGHPERDGDADEGAHELRRRAPSLDHPRRQRDPLHGEGDIKEVGDQDALVARGGKYAELYNSQFG